MTPDHWHIAARRLYLCTPDRADLFDFVEACIRGGVDVVQLRDKELDARSVLARAVPLMEMCHRHGVPFIMNDRPDLALEIGADGVHVGQDDAPVSLARRLLGPSAIVGLSTHSTDDLHRSLPQDVTYLSAGPVEPTPTKAGRPGTGIDYARTASSQALIPVFVTGGVTPERVPVLAAAGVSHFVVVRYLTEAPDPEAATRRLRHAIDENVTLHPDDMASGAASA